MYCTPSRWKRRTVPSAVASSWPVGAVDRDLRQGGVAGAPGRRRRGLLEDRDAAKARAVRHQRSRLIVERDEADVLARKADQTAGGGERERHLRGHFARAQDRGVLRRVLRVVVARAALRQPDLDDLRTGGRR